MRLLEYQPSKFSYRLDTERSLSTTPLLSYPLSCILFLFARTSLRLFTMERIPLANISSILSRYFPNQTSQNQPLPHCSESAETLLSSPWSSDSELRELQGESLGSSAEASSSNIPELTCTTTRDMPNHPERARFAPNVRFLRTMVLNDEFSNRRSTQNHSTSEFTATAREYTDKPRRHRRRRRVKASPSNEQKSMKNNSAPKGKRRARRPRTEDRMDRTENGTVDVGPRKQSPFLMKGRGARKAPPIYSGWN